MIMESLRILIAHSNQNTLTTINNAVSTLGHTVIDAVETGEALIKCSESFRPDLVISGVKMPDLDGIRALTLIGSETPVPGIIVTPKSDLELVETAALDHIMAWLVEPIRTVDLAPAILLVHRRAQEFAELRKENHDLRMALVDRKTIEQAKGILMKSAGLDEGDAFKRLQKMASRKRIRLIEMAQAVIHAEDAIDLK
ncbi:putative transcriptional regulatory protein pdtaR [Gimesia chilikensis]|uniref:Putative transcriptional regulatory protein pdtaR n=1 Tax=Gimesia chilikensis TaxID=2605989 RepID=A0A517W9G3_9PLAN|nr:ANTAR domain-containing protein [Gimesia chilikensis]QDU01865.1 putative transcriptional regulatory protein pdtaR [Gimesia chilikensis]